MCIAVTKQREGGIERIGFHCGGNRSGRISGGKGRLGKCVLRPGPAVGNHQETVLEITQRTETGFRAVIIPGHQILGSLGIEQEPFGILERPGFLERGDRDIIFFFRQCLLAGLPGALRRIGTAAEQQTGQQGEQEDKANQFFHIGLLSHLRIKKALGR